MFFVAVLVFCLASVWFTDSVRSVALTYALTMAVVASRKVTVPPTMAVVNVVPVPVRVVEAFCSIWPVV